MLRIENTKKILVIVRLQNAVFVQIRTLTSKHDI